MSYDFDVIIIGGGNGGFGVSAMVAETDKSIAFIEGWDFGGTCPNRGCTPKKVLVAAGHVLSEIEHASTHGIEIRSAKLDWSKLITRSKGMVGFIPDAMAGVAEKRGEVFRGYATFTGPNSVEVDGKEITAEHIVIATGSIPRPLNMPGSEHMITSDEVLSDTKQPESVVFIGGGVIAMEFGHVYARAGTQVTILEVMPQLLPRLDSDAVSAIAKESERIGITLKTSVKVEEIVPQGDKLLVRYEHDNEIYEVVVDKVINGAGRIANIANLNLEAANVDYEGVRIKTDEYMRSVTNPSVWVVGDAIATSPQLSPIATYEGRIVGKNIVNGPTETPDYSVLPSAVYTVPALASVGLSEQEAKQQGIDVEITQSDMTGWFSGKSYAESVAWSKIIINKKTNEFVGAHFVGHHGEELIHLFAMAMKFGIHASELKDAPFAFPTFSSDLKNIF